jgi:hypothetical protein
MLAFRGSMKPAQIGGHERLDLGPGFAGRQIPSQLGWTEPEG